MGTDQTRDVVATPRDRWCLAAALLHPDLKFKQRKEHRALARARAALELIEPTERLMDGKQGLVPLANDTKTYRLFTVSAETAEFLVETIGRIPDGLTAGNLAGIEPLLAQLEEKADAEKACAKHPNAATGAVVEDWARSSAPLVADPGKLVDELRGIAEASKKAGYDLKVFIDGVITETTEPAAGAPPAQN